MNNEKDFSPEEAVRGYAIQMEDMGNGLDGYKQAQQKMMGYCDANVDKKKFIVWHLAKLEMLIHSKLDLRAHRSHQSWMGLVLMLVNQLIYKLEGHFTAAGVLEHGAELYENAARDYDLDSAPKNGISRNAAVMLVDLFRIVNLGLLSPRIFPNSDTMKAIAEKLLISQVKITPEQTEVLEYFREYDKYIERVKFSSDPILDPYEKAEDEVTRLRRRVAELEAEVAQLRSPNPFGNRKGYVKLEEIIAELRAKFGTGGSISNPGIESGWSVKD
jgi:hypothetical protein